jgi:hypothetical protein
LKLSKYLQYVQSPKGSPLPEVWRRGFAIFTSYDIVIQLC